MAKVIKGDIVKVIQAKLVEDEVAKDLPQAVIRRVVRAYESTIKDFLAEGLEVPVAGVGTFTFRTRAAREAYYVGLPTLKDGIMPAQPEYSALKFKTSLPFKKEIKEKTAGNPFQLKDESEDEE